jgi:hypothetical protein
VLVDIIRKKKKLNQVRSLNSFLNNFTFVCSRLDRASIAKKKISVILGVATMLLSD